MSSSADSLKKKVCVTVFLDELFEEVEDGTEPIVKDVPQTEKEHFPPPLDIEEGKVSESAAEFPAPLRPRKHRRESKFSKNLYESLSSEIERFEFESNTGSETGKSEDDRIFSDSDFDWEEYLEKTKGLGLSLVKEDFGFRKKPQEERESDKQPPETIDKPKDQPKPDERNRTKIRIIVAKNKRKSEETDGNKTHQLKSILDEWTGEKIPDKDEHRNQTETCSDTYSHKFPRDERKYKTLLEAPNVGSERHSVNKQKINSESLLCYSSCVKECVHHKNENQNHNWSSSLSSRHDKANEQDNLSGDQREKKDPVKSSERVPLDTLLETPRENNLARGDAVNETSASDLFSGLGSQEQLQACEEILKRADEYHIEKEDRKKTSNYVAEFRFVKEGFSEGEDSQMTDGDSEMIFAENGLWGESGRADQVPHSGVVKRLKTVEILASEGTDDAEDTSTEIVLVCENVIAEDVSAGAWLSSGSSWQGFCGGTSQCFLKNSADSSMYLIEIPLRFAVPTIQRVFQ